MSETDAKTFKPTKEEEAILDACFRGNIQCLGVAIVNYGRALFAPAASETEKVECPNCREMVDFDWRHRQITYGPVSGSFPGGPYTCQSAPPEPAAPEMPAPIFYAIADLRRANFFGTAASLETFWSAQATAPKKLEKVRIALDTMRAHFEPNCQGQCRFPMVWTFCQEALAELDAHERGGREGEGKP